MYDLNICLNYFPFKFMNKTIYFNSTCTCSITHVYKTCGSKYWSCNSHSANILQNKLNEASEANDKYMQMSGMPSLQNLTWNLTPKTWSLASTRADGIAFFALSSGTRTITTSTRSIRPWRTSTRTGTSRYRTRSVCATPRSRWVAYIHVYTM